MRCPGWLITTADTCTEFDCSPDSGISHLHLSQVTDHYGLNRNLQEGFFRNFEDAIRSCFLFLFVFLLFFLFGAVFACFACFWWLWWLSFLWVSSFLWRFLGLGFPGFETCLDQQCHRDDIARCPGWLITTADTLHVV